jgi:hypothetical protein
VKEVAESVMREIVGQSNIAPILTEARQQTEQSVQKLMQDVLDYYGSGIRIDQVQLQKVDPPDQVIDAFRDVQAARADRERLQNEAFSYANKIIPEARGEAERILQAAKGYQQQTVAEATGQTARFLKVYEEYKKAPEVTRKRLYLETMERVLGGAEKIILDSKGGQGVVPFLPLDQLNKRKDGATEDESPLRHDRGDPGTCRRSGLLRVLHRASERAGDRARVRPSRKDHNRAWDLHEDPIVRRRSRFDKRILDLDTVTVGMAYGPEANYRRCFRTISHRGSVEVLSDRALRAERALASGAYHRKSSLRRVLGAQRHLPGRREGQARGAHEAHRPAGQRGKARSSARGRRRAHQARRPSRAELQEHLRPHAGRAAA